VFLRVGVAHHANIFDRVRELSGLIAGIGAITAHVDEKGLFLHLTGDLLNVLWDSGGEDH